MDRLKDISTPTLQRVFNAVNTLIEEDIPATPEVREELRQEMLKRNARSIDETIEWSMLSKQSISHTNLLQHWSRKFRAADIAGAISRLIEDGKVEVATQRNRRGKPRRTYTWIAQPKQTTGSPDTGINSSSGLGSISPATTKT